MQKLKLADVLSGMKRQLRRATCPLTGTFLLALLFAFSMPVSAQVACIYPAVGVPGLPGPPDWIGTFNPPLNTNLNDPRWNNASSITWADGTSGDTARFSALYSGGNLYLSWSVLITPNGNPQANVLYVGFVQNGGTTPVNFAATITLTSLTPGSDTSTYAPAAFQVDGTTGNLTPQATVPAWLSANTRVWITGTGFTVQMIVPVSTSGINTGLNLGTDFSMWFEMQEALPPSSPNTVWDAVFPDGRGGTPIAADVVSNGFNTVYPIPGSWVAFHLASGVGDPKCTLGGVSLSAVQIGTLNNDPITGLPAPNEILFPATGPANPALVNTFFASPTNGMTTAIAPGGITATFRIADWGSVADPNAPWTTIPGGQDVPSSIAIGAGATASNNTINFNWEVANTSSENWLTEFQSGSKPAHQCMLVELAGGALSTWVATHAFSAGAQIVDPNGDLQAATTAGTSGTIQPSFSAIVGGTTVDSTVTWTNKGPAIGPGLTFLNNSVFRNMEFTHASEFSRDAAINIMGLKPLSAAPRDVYLYVQTVNMPSVVNAEWKRLYYGSFGTPDARNPEKTRGALTQMSSAQMDQILPAYRVYVFHDAGEKISIDSTDYHIVHAQSGFGYYVLPDEDVNYWVHGIKGATEIAPNYYRIAVPNNGVSHVTTTIAGLVTAPSTGGPLSWWLLVIVVLIIAYLVYRFLKK
jgi:hypothetical protein